MTGGPLRLYPMALRHRVMAADGRTDEERFKNVVSRSSFYRWKARNKGEGHYEPRERGKWSHGRDRLLSVDGVLWVQIGAPVQSFGRDSVRARECSGLEHCFSRVFQISFNKPTFAAARNIGSKIDAGRRYRECVSRESHVFLESARSGADASKLPGPASGAHCSTEKYTSLDILEANIPGSFASPRRLRWTPTPIGQLQGGRFRPS